MNKTISWNEVSEEIFDSAPYTVPPTYLSGNAEEQKEFTLN